LNGIVNQGSKIIGIKQSSHHIVLNDLSSEKARAILAGCTHPLFHEFKILPSGYSMPELKNNRYN